MVNIRFNPKPKSRFLHPNFSLHNLIIFLSDYLGVHENAISKTIGLSELQMKRSKLENELASLSQKEKTLENDLRALEEKKYRPVEEEIKAKKSALSSLEFRKSNLERN